MGIPEVPACQHKLTEESVQSSRGRGHSIMGEVIHNRQGRKDEELTVVFKLGCVTKPFKFVH